MKIFKNLFLVLITVCIVSSCSEDNPQSFQTDPNTIDVATEILKRKSAEEIEEIINDPVFIEYIFQENDFLNRMVDPSVAQRILELGDPSVGLNQYESDLLAQQYGYDTFENLNTHFFQQQTRLNILDEKYKILSMPQEELLELGTRGHYLYFIDTTNITVDADCRARYNNCKIGAGALYFMGAAGCVGGGAIATGASAGTLATLATYATYVCLGANAAYYYSNLNECRYSYEDCQKK